MAQNKRNESIINKRYSISEHYHKQKGLLYVFLRKSMSVRE
jgi:hypothetical protein